MPSHSRKFGHIKNVLRSARNVLIVAHDKPDPDAVGSIVAMGEYLVDNYTCAVTYCCSDPLPEYLKKVIGNYDFVTPLDILASQLLAETDVIIGCDSIDRGFNRLIQDIPHNVITIGLDHHHDIRVGCDISIVDPAYAATTELLYDFMSYDGGVINPHTATALLLGILGDTGTFQHSNTSSHLLSTTAKLLLKGASISKISESSFSNQKIATLTLWGKALSHVQYFPDKKLAISSLTSKDFSGDISNDNIRAIADILVNAPSVDVALLVVELGQGMVKCSLRSTESSGTDVSEIAHLFGGGGHPRAAGFQLSGKLTVSNGGSIRIV